MASDESRNKWDARYRDVGGGSGTVAEVLRQYKSLLPSSGVALDLACGLGANALFLAEQGLTVHAWDISPVAIEKLLTEAERKALIVETQVRDCVSSPPESNTFDVVVVSRFLDRDLCPAIEAALRPGGLLFYQTFLHQESAQGGPMNPRFLLHKGELRRQFNSLQILVYREAKTAMLVGKKVGPAACRP